jgi:hypothetical protein
MFLVAMSVLLISSYEVSHGYHNGKQSAVRRFAEANLSRILPVSNVLCNRRWPVGEGIDLQRGTRTGAGRPQAWG